MPFKQMQSLTLIGRPKSFPFAFPDLASFSRAFACIIAELASMRLKKLYSEFFRSASSVNFFTCSETEIVPFFASSTYSNTSMQSHYFRPLEIALLPVVRVRERVFLCEAAAFPVLAHHIFHLNGMERGLC